MDDIVSYIYNEIGVAERSKFENHLTNCALCTDEFAAISNARFSVFEWRREEFADLATPEIVIPYPPTKIIVGETASAGPLAAIRAWLSLINFPVATAAGLVVLIGLGFFVLRFNAGVEPPIAYNAKSITPVETFNTPDVARVTNPKQPEVVQDVVTPSRQPSRQIRAVNVVEPRRSNIKKQLTVRNPVETNIAKNIPVAPVLSETYEESDDTSLRLSDLFADDDS